MYPTKEEIMAEPAPGFDPELVQIVKDWKNTFYEDWKGRNDKFIALTALIKALAPEATALVSNTYAFSPEDKVIILDGSKPSILSTLHEIGHYFHGASELEACRFSVWLFKICFPRSFEKLTWKGHMLKKQ